MTRYVIDAKRNDEIGALMRGLSDMTQSLRAAVTARRGKSIRERLAPEVRPHEPDARLPRKDQRAAA
jgi:hypothetical protein